MWILWGYSTKFYISPPKFKPLTLLGTNFADKVPLSYTFNWKKVHASHYSFNWLPALSPVIHAIVIKDILINSSLATRSSSCLLAHSPLSLVMLRKACGEGRLAPIINKFPKRTFSCHFHVVPNESNDTALRWCVSLKYFYQRLFNTTKWQISQPFTYLDLSNLYIINKMFVNKHPPYRPL